MNLKDYIRGQRRGKGANQLERKAMDDPFLQDAIEGYDSVEGDHISVIENLEKQFSSSQKQHHTRIWIWAAAAAIILLISIPLLLHKPYEKNDIPAIVSSEKIQKKQEISIPLLQEDTLLVTQHHKLEIEPANPPVEKIKNELILPENDLSQALAGHVVQTDSSDQELGKIFIRQEALALVNQSDKIVVSGRVVDETGSPLPGVTILPKNGYNGTISDIDGNFKLDVSKDEVDVLIASFVGMKESEIPLKENVGDIQMISNDLALNEVTIVAFGSQKKESVVGSVTSVSPSQLRRSSSNLRDATAGNVAGVVYNAPVFDKEDFIEYFTEHYDKDICAGQKISFKVKFYIDPIGQPGQINIKENSCPALEIEIKRLLLGSPLWSKRDRKVTLQIELP